MLLLAVGTYRGVWDAVRATQVMLLGALMLTSTAHPWYLLWPLALLPLRWSWTLWVASLVLPWSYLAATWLGPAYPQPLVAGVEWGVVWGVAAGEVGWWMYRRRPGRSLRSQPA